MAKRSSSSKQRAAGSASGKRRTSKKQPARRAAAKTRAGASRTSKSKRGVERGAARKRAAAKVVRRKTATRAAASRTRTPAPRKDSPLQTAASAVRGAAETAVAAVAARLPWTDDGNDPIALLEADHRRFEELLKQGEATTERAVKLRTRLLATLTDEINQHELIEERVLYPALEPHSETRDVVLEGAQEHHVADLLTKELDTLPKSDEQWGAKFKVLKESLEHHIQEEERRMFPMARAVFSREQLKDLAARMKALKAQLRS